MQKLDENGDPQWIDENDPALPGIQLTEDLVRREGMRCISDGEGGAIAVWSDERNRAFDIYAHRLNADGETADGWPEENLVINSAGSNQFGHSIISDGTGGVIIAWISGQRNGGNIYANKLDADGNLIWDDDPEGGVEIRLSERNNSYLSLCSDGSGGAFVSWTGYRENQEDSDIFCQRILEDGTIPWSDNGEIICDAPGDQNYSGIVSVEQGQAVIVWEHEVDNSNSDLYMQKIAGEDSILLHWEPEGEDRDGLTLCNDQLEQCDPSLAPDGEGGFIAAWYDERLGGSVPGDIYAQRVDSDARRIWLNGHDVLVTNARLKQTSPSLHVFNETVKTVWCDYRSGSPGIYTQFLEIAGGIAILDEDCEEIVSGKGYDGRHPRISIDGENLWFAWNDQRLGEMGEYIFIQRADLTEGAFAFGDEARMIIAPDFEEDDPIVMDSVAVAADGNGGIYLAWQENRYDHYFNIRTQLVNSNGQILWGDTGKSPTSDGRNVEYNRDLSKPRLLVTENGRLYVAFHKYIGHNYWQNVLIQRMSRGGEPMWTEEEHNALLVTNSELDHTVEGMTYFEDGSILLVIMRITGPSDYDLIAQRISSNGVLLWDEPLVICDTTGLQLYSKTIKMNGGVLVAWEDRRRGEPVRDIYGQKISADGSIHWQENGLVLAEIEGQQYRRNSTISIYDEDAWTFWLAWQDQNEQQDYDIYAQRFNWEGTPLLEPASGIPVCSTHYDECNPKIVVGSEQDAYIVWENSNSNFQVDLLYTHLDSDGIPIDERYENGGMVLSDARHQQISANIAKDGEGGFIAAWEDLRTTTLEFKYDIYTQRVNDGLVGTQERKSSQLPETWSLEAVYPNPFNSSLNIKVALPQNSRLQIKLYNILGKEAVTITDRFYKAGYHRFSFDSENLASGVYFINAGIPGKRNEIRKVVLVK